VHKKQETKLSTLIAYLMLVFLLLVLVFVSFENEQLKQQILKMQNDCYAAHDTNVTKKISSSL
jgi:hypothetical protein